MHRVLAEGQLATIAGGLIGGFFATNLGRSTIAGIEGWRCAFHLVALVSLITSGLTLWLAVDPRRKLAVRLSSDRARTPWRFQMHDGCNEMSQTPRQSRMHHRCTWIGVQGEKCKVSWPANRSPAASPCGWSCNGIEAPLGLPGMPSMLQPIPPEFDNWNV